MKWLRLFMALVTVGLLSAWGSVSMLSGTTGGITDFTGDPSCQGSWFLYSSGNEAGAIADQCSGAAQDGSNPASAQGTPVYNSILVPNGTVSGQDSVLFDGAIDFFEIADGSNDVFDSTDWTAGCWVLKTDGDANEIVINKGSGLRELNIQVQSTEIFRGYNNDNQGADGAITIDEWIHLAVRFTNGTGTVELFANGVASCSGSCVASTNRDDDAGVLSIGFHSAAGNSWTGNMMECFYFDSGISDTELCEILLCGFDGTADGAARDTAFGATGCHCSDITTCC